MNDQNKDLPPLPESSAWRYHPKDGHPWPAYTEREAQALAYDAQPEPLYTADQMRDYAIAALSRHCAAPIVRQNGSPVADAQSVRNWLPNDLCELMHERRKAIVALDDAAQAKVESRIIASLAFAYPAGAAPTPPAPQEVEQARDAGALEIACTINKKLGEYIAGRSYLLPEDLAALKRFHECATDFDSGGHDVSKDAMARLREIGVMQSLGFGRHQTTAFGDYVLARADGEPVKLPLKTLRERQAECAAMSAQPDDSGSHG